MKFSQKQLHERLAATPGTYKELFIEKSTDLSIRIVNGRVEPVQMGETTGVSLLLTQEKQRYFDASESLLGLDDLFARAASFDAPKGAMKWQPSAGDGTSGTSDKEYALQTRDLGKDMKTLRDLVVPHIEKLRSYPWITSTMVGFGLRDRSYIAVSSNVPGGQDSQYQVRIFVMAMGTRWEVSQEYYETVATMNSLESVTPQIVASCFESVVEHLDALLDAPESPSGEMDIVIAAEAGGVIIHEAVGHGLEGDLQASSAYANQIGQKVASSKVTVVDDPTIPLLRGSYEMDHEGHPAARAVLIKDGILQNYLHQTSSAEFLELPHNGHGRRETYANEAIVRMGNTYLDNGSDSREDIISSVKEGLLVTAIGGGQVNTTSGDFVFKINFARRIRNGVVGEVVQGANLSGNGPKMLQEISMVGNDLPVGHLSYFIGGTCGKDGQGAPVTDATPTIKVRLKVTG